MTTKPEDVVAKTWRQQVDTAVRLVETLTGESRKIREYQLAAALEAHRSAAAVRERLEKAADAQDLLRIQSEWFSASVEKSLAYWRGLYEASAQTQLGVLKWLCESANMASPQQPAAPNVALINMMSDAYKRWLDSTGQIYAAPAARVPEGRKAA